MKMTEKKKRYLITGGGIVLCAGLLAAIGLQLARPAGEDRQPEKDETVGEAVPGQSAVRPETGQEGGEAVPKTAPPTQEPASQQEPASDAAQPTQEPTPVPTAQPTLHPAPADSPAPVEQPEQSIQPEVEKPGQPEEPVLTNPEEKPDGEKVETSPEPVDHGTYVPPADDGGGNSGGGLPGFGNVPNMGPNTAIQADDMYENGNKIGSMD